MILSKSSKQKLNMKSSTETELVGVIEYLLYHFWLINFLKLQGVAIDRKLLLQGNQSAIRMERNGWNSCTGNSSHIDIHFFFVYDRVQSGNIDIQYCPTDEMVPDFFTKPLQGQVFYKFWDLLMGTCDIPITIWL